MNFLLFKMFPPDMSYFSHAFIPLLDTVKMSFAGTGIGAILAIVYGSLCTHFINQRRYVRNAMRIVVQLIRTIPVLIIALTSTFLFGTTVFSGTVAITIYTFAVLSRICYEDMDKAPSKAFDSVVNCGVSRSKAFVRCIIPHVITGYIENVLYLLEANVRHAAILGYVGAGGIGLLLDEKLSWRQYNQAGTILVMLFFVVALLETLSQKLKKKYIRQYLAAVSVIFLISIASIDRPVVSSAGIKIFTAMIQGLTHPSYNLIFDFTVNGVPYLIIQTVFIAFLGTVIGVIPSFIFAFMQVFMSKTAGFITHVFVCIVRTIPVFVYAVTFIRIFGPGAYSGIATMAALSTGLLTKRFSVVLKEMNKGAYNALITTGVSNFAAIKYAVLPQIFPRIKKVFFYRFDINLRDASVLGFAGAGGIGAPLIFAMSSYRWNDASAILIPLLLVIIAIDLYGEIKSKKFSAVLLPLHLHCLSR